MSVRAYIGELYRHAMDIRVGFLEFLMGLFGIYEGEKKFNGISCIYF